MNIKKESLATDYLPVPWEYRGIIEERIAEGTSGKIIYFCQEGLCERNGAIVEMKDIPREGIYIFLDNGDKIRIDRIITMFGKPGAAYDEYNAYADACMDCTGGYDKEELKGYSI